METGRFFINPSTCRGNMLFLGNGDSVFRGGRSMMSIEDSSKKRPFFSSPDELFDEGYCEEKLHEKKRRLTPEQVHLLEESFEAENKLEPERKTLLAKKLGLQPRQVAVWFQNRRARWKTKQLERDFDLLKSSYDSLRANYDSVLKENEKLKSELASLNEKIRGREAVLVPISAEKSESLGIEVIQVSPLQFSMKVEDRLSCGSGGSAVVDEEGLQLVDSGDSYFPSEDYATGCLARTDGIPSDEYDGSDDGRSYFSDVFLDPEPEQPNHEADGLAWWDWS